MMFHILQIGQYQYQVYLTLLGKNIIQGESIHPYLYRCKGLSTDCQPNHYGENEETPMGDNFAARPNFRFKPPAFSGAKSENVKPFLLAFEQFVAFYNIPHEDHVLYLQMSLRVSP